MEVRTLLHSKFHEERLLAVLMLVQLFKSGDESEQKLIFDLYLENTGFINNWDIVDISASNIVGAHLYEKDKKSQEYLKKKFENIKNIFILEEIDKSKLFDLVVATDVIEHIEKDNDIIKYLSGLIKKNGNILLTVPAYNFLYNERDKFLGHFRRYNTKMIKNITEQYFKTIKLSYYNFFLFFLSLVLFTMIKILKVKSFITSAEKTPNSTLNNFFCYIFSQS